MNPKQTVPLAVALAPAIAAAPAVLIGGAIGFGIVWLIKSVLDNDKTPAAETDPAKTELETTRKTPEFERNEAEKPAFREIPAVPSVPLENVSPASFVRPTSAVAVAVQPIAKKAITRADMATIFEAGKRPLSRLDAVAALKQLGFGKTAAYAATAPDGRFSAWLVFSSDGIIYWMENCENP